MGSMLARAAGLSVPDYGIVRITETFAAANRRSPEGARLADNVGLNFGSKLVEPVIDASSCGPDTWGGPLAFDSLLMNPDRTKANPNALFDGSQLHLIDHGMVAPTWVLDSQNVADDVLYGTPRIASYAGFDSLRRRGFDFGTAVDKVVEVLKLDTARAILSSIPDEWLGPREAPRLAAFLEARLLVSGAQQLELTEVVG